MNTTTVNNFESNDLSGDNHFKPEPDGYRCYSPIEVNKNGGALITKGSFSAVEIYCTKQQWFPGSWEGWRTDHKTYVPFGIKGTEATPTAGSPSEFTYPKAERLGLVLFQRLDDKSDTKVNYHKVTADSLGSAQRIDLDSQVKNIYIAVNDIVPAPGYSDNSGAFEIHVKLIA